MITEIKKVEQDTVFYTIQGKSKIILNKDVDLCGKVCVLPSNITIDARGGCFKNGTLIGDNTSLSNSKCVFDHIKIEGVWCIDTISTSLFKDLSYVNSLRDVIALTNKRIHNNVIINESVYKISLDKNNKDGIVLNSNTDLILNGTILLEPNDFTNYQILLINGDNIKVSGKGHIKGDKLDHLGQKGEWGMGIDVEKSNSVIIDGIAISDCWGDCIYVGGDSKNITIRNCELDNGRRQGISITSGSDINIDNCFIKNISGTKPEFAIDIEPNANQRVDRVVIKKCKAINCVGGISIYGKASNAKIGRVEIYDSSMEGTTEKYPIRILQVDEIVVQNCRIDTNSEYVVLIRDVNSATIRSNEFITNGKKPINAYRCSQMSDELNRTTKR